MKVPFLDLSPAAAELDDELDSALAHVVRSGRYVLGEELERFEAAFARYVGARFCFGVANGLDALRLTLLAMGVGEHDEVIVPANTFIATWLAVSACGATPVPVEPDPQTYNIDPDAIESAIPPRTRVLVPDICTGNLRRWMPSSPLPVTMGSECSTTRPRLTVRESARGAWEASGTPQHGASTPARTWGRSAMAAPSPPMTRRSLMRSMSSETMVPALNT